MSVCYSPQMCLPLPPTSGTCLLTYIRQECACVVSLYVYDHGSPGVSASAIPWTGAMTSSGHAIMMHRLKSGLDTYLMSVTLSRRHVSEK